MIKNRVRAAVLGVLLLVGVVATAQKPAQNVSAAKHPNLAAAQRLSEQAFNKITAAQQANEYDMGGHAGRAIQLMREARYEMQAAAEAATR